MRKYTIWTYDTRVGFKSLANKTLNPSNFYMRYVNDLFFTVLDNIIQL